MTECVGIRKTLHVNIAPTLTAVTVAIHATQGSSTMTPEALECGDGIHT